MVLDNDNHFIDVVILGYNRNLIRCIKSRKPSQAPSHDLSLNLYVLPPRFVYHCGTCVFTEKAILNTVAHIKDLFKSQTIGRKLQQHDGAPFSMDSSWIGSISKGGNLLYGGHSGQFRIILSKDLQVMGIAMYVQNELKKCKKMEHGRIKNHDKGSYHCYDTVFNNPQLEAAAEQACKKLFDTANTKYPALYEGPKFEYKKEYLTFPISSSSLFGDAWTHPGPYRVAISWDCEVVGAFTAIIPKFINDKSPAQKGTKKLRKCHRMTDNNSVPPVIDWNTRIEFGREIYTNVK
ncbi:putative guanyl-specific ribonuclease f1 [Erysiphe neolycopersici]|uniref:Putative guanyl-specific ribonuclease f1 n=1 Tax=Erysiphe neolycopersici TaxID=212602 RepID=A0A420HDR1_9PEZI|nr:putative guanyl-specific ribonuclease f1 [Erysiphe neolycopersici]